MKFDFPQVDLPCEILAWNDVTEDILNIYKQSCRLKAGIFAICTEGKMTATINLIDYEIKPNDLITLLPGTIIQFRERTEKVRLCFAGFSSECVERINLIKSMVSSFSKITECPIVELQEDIASYLIDYFSLLARVTCDEKLSLPSEMTEVSLRSILTAVGLIYQRYSSKNHNTNRKEEICRESQTQIEQHDYPGNRLFTELPQCFVLWKIFQEICRHESAGVQKQLTTFSGKDIQNPFLPQRAESNTEQTSNYG